MPQYLISRLLSALHDLHPAEPEFSEHPLGHIGWLLVVVGFILVTKTISLLRKRAFSDVVRTPNTLITDGLFALSRNPLYVAELLTVTGVAIVLGSLSAFIAPVAYVAIVGGFGAAYRGAATFRPRFNAYIVAISPAAMSSVR